jgi:hypothetical protein
MIDRATPDGGGPACEVRAPGRPMCVGSTGGLTRAWVGSRAVLR